MKGAKMTGLTTSLVIVFEELHMYRGLHDLVQI